MNKRHSMLFAETLWERLQRAAIKESAKQKKTITIADYVRQILDRNLNRKNIKDKSNGKGCVGCKYEKGKVCEGCIHRDDIVKDSKRIIET